jgi:two-component system, cell cycle sensor histidine kinase and response regulator CckA
MDIFSGDLCPEDLVTGKCPALGSLLSLLDRLPALVWTTDNQCRFTALTGAGLDAAGLSAKEYGGRHVEDLFGGLSANTSLVTHRNALQGHGGAFQAEVNGRSLEAHVEPLRRPDHTVVGCIGVALDATERLVAETLYRLSEQSYRSLIEDAPYAMCRATESGQLLQVNRAMLEMLGYDLSCEPDLLVRDLPFVYASPEEFGAFVAALQLGLVQGLESTWVRVDGLPIQVRVGGRATRDAQGQILHVDLIAENVTERKELEARLAQAQKMQAIGQLAGGIAHDFNNLLTVINGYCDLLLVTQCPDSGQRESLELIRHAGERATNLTQQLLAFSRKQVTQKQSIRLNAVVLEVMQLSRRLIGENITLIELLGDTAGQVLADPIQIHQMLMNLVINARDAMEYGGRLTVTTGGLSLGPDLAKALDVVPGDYALLTVTDTGIGMDDTVLSHMFEPFFTTKEVGKGTGLGLSTAYGIVRQSRGAISVDSFPGNGTTFRIYLPRFVDEMSPALGDPRLPQLASGASTILLVEDENAVRQFAATVLARSGYTVLQATNAEEALALAGEYHRPIHLLLTDIVMPGLNGRDLARRFSSLRAESKILLTSGYSDGMAGVSQLDPTVNYLPKPFSAEKLTQVVKQVLAGDRSEPRP